MTNDDAIETTVPEPADAVADRPAPQRGGCLIVFAILLPVAYVLSFPFFALTMRFCLWMGWMGFLDALAVYGGVFYRPLEWLCHQSELFDSMFNWYLNLFGDSIYL